MAVWPFLLVACGIAAYWNWRIALLFALHIIGMQIIKALALPQEQALFFACHVIFALLGYLLLDKNGAFVLAAIGLIYAISLFGIVPQMAKVIIAEIAFILGLAFGGYMGPDPGVWASNGLYSGGRVPAEIDASQVHKNSPPETD